MGMRMRFQSGYAEQFDGANPESKKPRLAVTTRTLEALIRLATAHAKLKLRKDEVLKEDVMEAYRLMMAAREEEVPTMPAAPADGPDGGDDGQGPSGGARRGKKRSRREAAASPSQEEAITAARVKTFTLLVARVFGRRQTQQLARA